MTLLLFLTMSLAFLLTHVDDGILSIASEHIIRDFNLTESDLGFIEGSMYFGLALGSLLTPLLFGILSPKVLMVLVVFSTSCCPSAWVFFDKFWFLAGARFLCGLFQVSNILKIQSTR